MKKIDYKLFIAVVILSLFGVLMIFSASSIWAEYKFNDEFKYLKLQAFFLVIGLIAQYIISKVDYTN